MFYVVELRGHHELAHPFSEIDCKTTSACDEIVRSLAAVEDWSLEKYKLRALRCLYRLRRCTSCQKRRNDALRRATGQETITGIYRFWISNQPPARLRYGLIGGPVAVCQHILIPKCQLKQGLHS